MHTTLFLSFLLMISLGVHPVLYTASVSLQTPVSRSIGEHSMPKGRYLLKLISTYTFIHTWFFSDKENPIVDTQLTYIVNSSRWLQKIVEKSHVINSRLIVELIMWLFSTIFTYHQPDFTIHIDWMLLSRWPGVCCIYTHVYIYI